MHKSHTSEKFSSWDMDENALNQSDCSIFKLTISLEQNHEKAWFFAYWCRFIEIKSWLKNIGMGIVKNGCGHSGLRTLKLALCQEGINGVSWFVVCWQKFRKCKSSEMVRNGRGLLGLETPKSAVSQEWIDEMSWFFSC